ncbi:hypothetical protein [Sulfurimonas sp.]|uniref:hypothetical protein n=1 Tax=Sulfurimonas sp. TaxID=2022749 RepID=UPI003D0C4491
MKKMLIQIAMISTIAIGLNGCFGIQAKKDAEEKARIEATNKEKAALCTEYKNAIKEFKTIVAGDRVDILTDKMKQQLIKDNKLTYGQYDCVNLSSIKYQMSSRMYRPKSPSNIATTGIINWSAKTNTINVDAITKNYLEDTNTGYQKAFQIEDDTLAVTVFPQTQVNIDNKTNSSIALKSYSLYYGSDIMTKAMNGDIIPPQARKKYSYMIEDMSQIASLFKGVYSKDDFLKVGVAISYTMDGVDKTFFQKKKVYYSH